MYQNIFDSHSHYDDEQFDSDRIALLEALPQQGIVAIMTAADSLASAERAQTIAEQFPFVFFAAGVHPHAADTAPVELEAQLEHFAKHSKMRAVGEIGLDYYYDYTPRKQQQDIFARQLAVAVELHLPVIIHDREAHHDTMELVQKYHPKGVIHSYSGSVEFAEQYLELGMYLGFTGMVTFKNAKKPLEVLQVVPLDRILIETDCPYLAPVPMRGKRSDSGMIPYTAQKIAEVKGISVQEVLDQTCKNACDLFNITKQELFSTH